MTTTLLKRKAKTASGERTLEGAIDWENGHTFLRLVLTSDRGGRPRTIRLRDDRVQALADAMRLASARLAGCPDTPSAA